MIFLDRQMRARFRVTRPGFKRIRIQKIKKVSDEVEEIRGITRDQSRGAFIKKQFSITVITVVSVPFGVARRTRLTAS